METYNYFEAIKNDVLNVLSDYPRQHGESREDYAIRLNDELWVNDSVTGNGSGSYTFNAYTAAEYLCHNWDLLADALEAFGGDTDIIRQGEESCDVTIRCYLLGQCIEAALDEIGINKEIEEETEEE